MTDTLVTKVTPSYRKLKSRKMTGSWSFSVECASAEAELSSILAQNIADEIDKEILDDVLYGIVIEAHFHQVPKKGDLVRYGRDPRRKIRNAAGVITGNEPREITNGLCCEAYDPETNVPGQILFEDGSLRYFRPATGTQHAGIEVISV